MTGQELLTEVQIAYRGKDVSRHPVWGSPKANTLISIANRKQREWATDPRNKWNSLFEIRAISPALDTGVLTYDLDSDFFQPSDYLRIIRTNGSVTEYPIVKAQQRGMGGQGVYIHGNNPKKLTFAQSIDTGLHAGTIYMPGYYLPAEIVNSTDLVTVDDPNWLVYITASELARNDPAKEDQYPALLSMANDIYRKMSDANNDVGYGQPNTIANFMPQIGNSEDWF